MDDYLGMQYIVDGNGNYYRVNGNDQLVVAECKEEASVFTSTDANQRISGGKKAKSYLAQKQWSSEVLLDVKYRIAGYLREKQFILWKRDRHRSLPWLL